jgi:hypothetical protein
MADDCPASTLEKRLRLSQLVEQRLSATRKPRPRKKDQRCRRSGGSSQRFWDF